MKDWVCKLCGETKSWKWESHYKNNKTGEFNICKECFDGAEK